jgi:hypothetical protein
MTDISLVKPLTGTWKQVSQENVDKQLEAQGKI